MKLQKSTKFTAEELELINDISLSYIHNYHHHVADFNRKQKKVLKSIQRKIVRMQSFS